MGAAGWSASASMSCEWEDGRSMDDCYLRSSEPSGVDTYLLPADSFGGKGGTSAQTTIAAFDTMHRRTCFRSGSHYRLLPLSRLAKGLWCTSQRLNWGWRTSERAALRDRDSSASTCTCLLHRTVGVHVDAHPYRNVYIWGVCICRDWQVFAVHTSAIELGLAPPTGYASCD